LAFYKTVLNYRANLCFTAFDLHGNTAWVLPAGGTTFLQTLQMHNNMDSKELKEKWPQIQARLKAEYPHLSTEELIYEIGKEAELLHRLQEKLGKNKEEIDNWLKFMG
jgi:hypothetical protein